MVFAFKRSDPEKGIIYGVYKWKNAQNKVYYRASFGSEVLGNFKTREEAVSARLAKEQEYLDSHNSVKAGKEEEPTMENNGFTKMQEVLDALTTIQSFCKSRNNNLPRCRGCELLNREKGVCALAISPSQWDLRKAVLYTQKK